MAGGTILPDGLYVPKGETTQQPELLETTPCGQAELSSKESGIPNETTQEIEEV